MDGTGGEAPPPLKAAAGRPGSRVPWPVSTPAVPPAVPAWAGDSTSLCPHFLICETGVAGAPKPGGCGEGEQSAAGTIQSRAARRATAV